MAEERFGFYSYTQEQRNGRYWVYASVDNPGSNVRVTEVSPNPNQPNNFPDRQSVGRVGRYLTMVPARRRLILDFFEQDMVAGS